MTCFWTGLLAALDTEPVLGVKKPAPQQFVRLLKERNCRTEGVSWNGEPLGKQLLDENYQAIQDFNLATINRGYDCSCCDPFLLLIAELFKIDIHHQYNKTQIRYTHPNSSKTVRFASNRGHFWKVK